MSDVSLDGLVAKASKFAHHAHEGQFRKNKAASPFIIHPKEVAGLVSFSGGSVEEVAAAWLHDTVEDTSVTLSQIKTLFGARVAEIVDGLTDPPEFKGLPLVERKSLQAERVKGKDASVKRVKLADQIANVRSVATDPPVSWDLDKCLEYVAGADLIADQCAGVSILLDNRWTRVHLMATRSLSKLG